MTRRRGGRSHRQSVPVPPGGPRRSVLDSAQKAAKGRSSRRARFADRSDILQCVNGDRENRALWRFSLVGPGSRWLPVESRQRRSDVYLTPAAANGCRAVVPQPGRALQARATRSSSSGFSRSSAVRARGIDQGRTRQRVSAGSGSEEAGARAGFGGCWPHDLQRKLAVGLGQVLSFTRSATRAGSARRTRPWQCRWRERCR